jgi:hypothetical protein
MGNTLVRRMIIAALLVRAERSNMKQITEACKDRRATGRERSTHSTPESRRRAHRDLRLPPATVEC